MWSKQKCPLVFRGPVILVAVIQVMSDPAVTQSQIKNQGRWLVRVSGELEVDRSGSGKPYGVNHVGNGTLVP